MSYCYRSQLVTIIMKQPFTTVDEILFENKTENGHGAQFFPLSG